MTIIQNIIFNIFEILNELKFLILFKFIIIIVLIIIHFYLLVYFYKLDSIEKINSINIPPKAYKFSRIIKIRNYLKLIMKSIGVVATGYASYIAIAIRNNLKDQKSIEKKTGIR